MCTFFRLFTQDQGLLPSNLLFLYSDHQRGSACYMSDQQKAEEAIDIVTIVMSTSHRNWSCGLFIPRSQRWTSAAGTDIRKVADTRPKQEVSQGNALSAAPVCAAAPPSLGDEVFDRIKFNYQLKKGTMWPQTSWRSSHELFIKIRRREN